MTLLEVVKPAMLGAFTIAAAGQVIDVQVSGAQVVGTAISVTGFVIAGLITLVAWLASNKLSSIEEAQKKQGATLDWQNEILIEMKGDVTSLKDWRNKREGEHEQQNVNTISELRKQLSEAKAKGKG